MEGQVKHEHVTGQPALSQLMGNVSYVSIYYKLLW